MNKEIEQEKIPTKISGVPDELQETIINRLKDQCEFIYILDKNKNPVPVIVKNIAQEKKHLCRCKKTGDIYGGYSGFYIGAYRNYLTEEEIKYIREWREAKTEASNFEKAKKINFSEWNGEQFFDGNNFYVDLDMFFEDQFEAYGVDFDKWNKYVWATKERPYITSKEAENIYQSDFDGLDHEFDWDVYGVENLQIALDEFVKINESNTAFYPDYELVLLLDDEIEKHKKEYEDDEKL